MKNKNLVAVLCSIVVAVAFFGCVSKPVAVMGGGSDTEVSGFIKDSSGASMSRAIVYLMQQDVDPIRDTGKSTLFTDTTNAQGRYVFNKVPNGIYNVNALHTVSRTRSLLLSVVVDKDTVFVKDDTLSRCGSIRVQLPDSAASVLGYVYIPGTPYYAYVNNVTGVALFDSLPAGIMPSVCYAAVNMAGHKVVGNNVQVVSGDTTSLTNTNYAFVKTLVLNTSASGANVSGTVTNFPVLVRLTSATIDFTQVKQDGSDIMFTKTDNTRLPYEIERWDAISQQGDVWVKVDTISGNDSTQSILMYYGTASGFTAQRLSNSSSVFDTADGYMGVWHLNVPGNLETPDATMHRFHGSPYGMTAASSVSGIVGNACSFDGATSYFQMNGTEAGALNFTPDNAYSISAWVLVDVVDKSEYLIAGKSNYQYGLQIYGGKYDFYQFLNNTGWVACNSVATAKSWEYVTGVYVGKKQYLYVNGVLTKAVSDTAPPTSDVLRDETLPFTIGRQLKGNNRFFKGIIDEVRVCNKAESADRIRLNYMNQKRDGKLIVFK